MKRLILIVVLVVIWACDARRVEESGLQEAPVKKVKDFAIEVVSENWRPYNFEENGEVKGTSSVLVKKALEKVKWPYSITIYPWARAYRIALNKPNVLIYTIMRIPQREKLFKWVRPLGPPQETWLWKKKDNDAISINKLQDAKKYTVVTNRDSMDHIWLKANGFQDRKNFYITNSVQDVLRMTRAGRVELMAFSLAVFESEVRKAGMNVDDFEKVFPLFSTQPYIAFSRSTKDDVVDALIKAYDDLEQ